MFPFCLVFADCLGLRTIVFFFVVVSSEFHNVCDGFKRETFNFRLLYVAHDPQRSNAARVRNMIRIIKWRQINGKNSKHCFKMSKNKVLFLEREKEKL